MIDPLYNGILATLIVLWLLAHRTDRIGKLVSGLKRFGIVLTVLLWAAFLTFLIVFVTNFHYFDDIHDIDEAVETAVVSLDSGINPYEEYVVPRFKGKYVTDPDWAFGPYNYMPLDLLTYYGAYKVAGDAGSPYWFVAVNLLFCGAALLILRRLVDVPLLPYVPFAGIVMLFYSFDNASLTLLLMVSSVYVLERGRWHPEVFAIILMGMATLTKIYAALPFVVLLLYLLQEKVSMRDLQRLGEVVAATAICGVMALALMMPFGISSVMDAAIFFHTSEELRVGTSTGGTILSEIAIDSEYFGLIAMAVVLIAVVAGMFLRNMNDRVLMVIAAFLMVSVKSSLAPLTVAGIFLVLRMRQLHDEKHPTADSPAPSGMKGTNSLDDCPDSSNTRAE